MHIVQREHIQRSAAEGAQGIQAACCLPAKRYSLAREYSCPTGLRGAEHHRGVRANPYPEDSAASNAWLEAYYARVRDSASEVVQ